MPIPSDEDMKRISRTVTYVERLQRSAPVAPSQQQFVAPIVQLIRVTGDPAVSGRYPAVVQDYDADADTWSDLTDADCYAIDPDGGTLEAGTYLARRWGEYNSLPVFTPTEQGLNPTLLIIAEVNGTPSYTDITTLTVDSADGLTLTQPGAGQARLDIAAATASQAGVVSTTTQTIGGEKTFLSDLTKMTAITVGGSYIDINPYNAVITVGPYSKLGKDGSDAYTYVSHTNSVSAESAIVRVYGDIGAGQGRVTFDHNLNSGGVYPSIGLGYNSGLTRVYGLADTGSVGAIFPTRVVSGITISATSLSDPGADRIAFWDDSAGTMEWLEAGTGLSISGTTISCTVTAYTTENAQDDIGSILVDSSTIAFTYSDATPSITASVIDDSITNAKLANAAAYSIKANLTSGSANPTDAALADITTATPVAGDFVIGMLDTGEVRKYDVADLTGGASSSGEVILDTPGTSTVDFSAYLTGATDVTVECWGPSGGSAGGTSSGGYNSGGGSGGGGYARTVQSYSPSDTAVTYTIPSGGTGGSVGNNGSAASGSTSFDTTVAVAGPGGYGKGYLSGGPMDGGAGGTATGTVTTTGGNGGDGVNGATAYGGGGGGSGGSISNGSAGADGAAGSGGEGGAGGDTNPLLGAGGDGSGTAGQQGAVPGGGSSGGGAGSYAGADGRPGRIRLTWGSSAPGAPATHAITHKSGGTDPIKLDELAAPTDVTTLNASTSAHGLLKKLSNVSTEFMNGAGNWTSLAIGTDVPSLTAAATANVVINGGFRYFQLQDPASATSRSDDTIGPDCWNVLTQSNPITSERIANPFDGARFAARLSQANASAQRFGLSHIIEGRDCVHLRGSAVTLSGRARMSASTTLRYAILEWTGTEDSPTSDIVNDWTSGTYTTGNFFTSTTLTVTGTGSIALTANTWADITALTGTLGSSVNNAMVLFWTDSTQAQNVTLDLANIVLVKGSTTGTFDSTADDGDKVRRFCQKSMGVDVAPADSCGLAGAFTVTRFPTAGFPTMGFAAFNPRMRTTPTVTLVNPSASSSDEIRNTDAGSNVPGAVQNTGETGTCVYANTAGASTTQTHAVHWLAEAWL